MDLTFYLQTFDHFIIYLGVSLVLFLIGTYIFKFVTPYSEREQIKNGNTAVSLKLLGKMGGLVVVLQSAIRHSINLVDLAIWRSSPSSSKSSCTLLSNTSSHATRT
nr:DUF350 domain-containing protein [Halalkalibacter wakoensis]